MSNFTLQPIIKVIFYDLKDAETGQTVKVYSGTERTGALRTCANKKKKPNSRVDIKVPISPEIFMNLDGDWAQIEVLIDQMLPKFTVANVECYKYPGRCSLLFQPNDNMHSHAILHKLFEASTTKHKNDKDFVHIPDPMGSRIASTRRTSIENRGIDWCYVR